MFDDGLFDLFSGAGAPCSGTDGSPHAARVRAPWGWPLAPDADTAGYPSGGASLELTLAGRPRTVTARPLEDGMLLLVQPEQTELLSAQTLLAVSHALQTPLEELFSAGGNARSGVGGAGGFQAPTFDRRLPAGALPAAPPVRPSARLRRRTERRTDAPAREDRALRLFRQPLPNKLESLCAEAWRLTAGKLPRGSFTAGSTESVWVRPSASCSQCTEIHAVRLDPAGS